jgi:hypothetical protein
MVALAVSETLILTVLEQGSGGAAGTAGTGSAGTAGGDGGSCIKHHQHAVVAEAAEPRAQVTR